MKKALLFLFLSIVLATIEAQTPPIVYVSSDGSGDFNCDGTGDQVQINQALDFVASDTSYTTVYLKGPATYWIDNTIYISSNTILEGDSTAKIKLIDHANWNTQFKALIMQKGATFSAGMADTSNSVHDITIRGFEIDGNRDQQDEPSGNSYYNIIKLQNCYNITINNMYLHHNLADAVNIQSCCYGYDINMKFFGNRVVRSGHDGIYVGLSVNFEIYDNLFLDNRTDAHIRAQDCNQFKIYGNICGNNPRGRNSGGIGIDIQVKDDTPLNDLEIYNNYLFGKGSYHGIWLWQTRKGGDLNTHSNVYIHHNIITGHQASGIGIYGFNNTLIENNTIEFNGKGNNHSYTDNVLLGKQSGITFYKGADGNKIRGFKTIVRNNIIGNSAAYGIENKKEKIHSFVLEYNDIYNNAKGAYKGASSTTDIYIHPDFACDEPTVVDGRIDYTYYIFDPIWEAAANAGEYMGDLGTKAAILVYHLKSEDGRWDGSQWVYDDLTSFCINTGSPYSDYFYEPSPNGSRINIGAFGGTPTASMSDKIPDVHHFMAYPNPTSGLITISEEFVGNEFYVFSLSGKLLLQGVLDTNSIDLSNLSNGIYLIKIRAHHSDHWRTGKVVKVK